MFKNMFKNKKLIALFVLVLVISMYKCYSTQTDYFVVKVGPKNQEVLLDHTDFAEIMNGLKPTSISGTFTKDDLSEMIREFKRHGLDQFYKRCPPGNANNDTDCRRMSKVLALVKEAASVIHPVAGNKITTKDQWLKAIVDVVLTDIVGE